MLQKKEQGNGEDKTMQAVAELNTRSLRFEPLDKNSFTPMYYQIQTHLLKAIRSGQLNAGDALPSEEELSRVYGVSRMTSRHALQSLTSQGFASRHRGRGTFVILPKVEKDIAHLSGFTAEMLALGMKAASQVLAATTISATADIASQLRVEFGAPVFKLCRLRSADGLPMAIEESCLSLDRFPEINKIDFGRISLYETLRNRYEIKISLADEILESRAASRHEAELLGIPLRSSLLMISRILWSGEGKPIEVAHSLYRGDRYRAVLRIAATSTE
jgi:GntR family transcriptional regulator